MTTTEQALADLQDATGKLLKCFGDCEGTWYEHEWESFGISPAQAETLRNLGNAKESR